MDPADVNAIAHRVTALQAAANPVVGAVGYIAGAVQAVAVKVPTFWTTSPKVWFSLLESQFATTNITAYDTKYHNAVQGLDKTTAEEISAFLLNPPAIGKFDALKTLLISTFGLTQADKDASLLAISGMGDSKPSGLLRYMNSLATTDDQKSMVCCAHFLWQLPESVHVVLARDSPTSITDLAKAADDNLAAQIPASGIAAVSAGEMGRRAHPSSGKTGTRCFYNTKFGEKARKCGDTSSAATCDMAHFTELGKRLHRPLAVKAVGNHHQDGRNMMSVLDRRTGRHYLIDT